MMSLRIRPHFAWFFVTACLLAHATPLDRAQADDGKAPPRRAAKAPTKTPENRPPENRPTVEFALTPEQFLENFAKTQKDRSSPTTGKAKKPIALEREVADFLYHAYSELSAEKRFPGIPAAFLNELLVNAELNKKEKIDYSLLHATLMNWFGIGPLHYQSIVTGFRSVGDLKTTLAEVRTKLDEDFVDMADGKSALMDLSEKSLLGLKDPKLPAVRLGFFGGTETGKTSLPTAWAKLMGYRVATISLAQFTGDSPREIVPQFLSFVANELFPRPNAANSSVVFVFTQVELAHPVILDSIVETIRDREFLVNTGDGPRSVKLQHTGFILNTTLGTNWIDDFTESRITEMNELRRMGFNEPARAKSGVTGLQLQQVILRALTQTIDNESRVAQLGSVFSLMDAWIPCTRLGETGFREALQLSLKKYLAAKSQQFGIQFVVSNGSDFVDYVMKNHYVASAKPGFSLAVRFVERFMGGELLVQIEHSSEWKQGQPVVLAFNADRFESSMKPIACGGLLAARERATAKK